jgi:hypothetical protein
VLRNGYLFSLKFCLDVVGIAKRDDVNEIERKGHINIQIEVT